MQTEKLGIICLLYLNQNGSIQSKKENEETSLENLMNRELGFTQLTWIFIH
jgi:hypothetical protein